MPTREWEVGAIQVVGESRVGEVARPRKEEDKWGVGLGLLGLARGQIERDKREGMLTERSETEEKTLQLRSCHSGRLTKVTTTKCAGGRELRDEGIRRPEQLKRNEKRGERRQLS